MLKFNLYINYITYLYKKISQKGLKDLTRYINCPEMMTTTKKNTTPLGTPKLCDLRVKQNKISNNDIYRKMSNTNSIKDLTKSQLIDLVLNQNVKIKQLEQCVENLNKNSLKNPSTNYLEDTKTLGYNWMSLLRKKTRQKVIDKVTKF